MEWLEHKTGGKRAGGRAARGSCGARSWARWWAWCRSAASRPWRPRSGPGASSRWARCSRCSCPRPTRCCPSSSPSRCRSIVILKILGAKIVVGMVMGFVVDAAHAPRAPHRRAACTSTTCASATTATAMTARAASSRAPLKHTLQVTVFIFVITIVLNGGAGGGGRGRARRVPEQRTRCSRCSDRRWWALCPTARPAWSSRSCTWSGVLGSGAMLAGLLVSGGRGPAGARAHEPPLEAERCHHRRPVCDGRRSGASSRTRSGIVF